MSGAPIKAPECVIVCRQSVDCGAWPNGACETACGQAVRAEAVPRNQCDGCQAGMPMRGDIHTDDGHAVMLCQRERYAPPAAQAEPTTPEWFAHG